MPTRRLVDQATAAEYLGMTPDQVRWLKYKRALPFVKINGHLRFDLADLDRLIESNKTPVAS
jgi:hypothetical protein